MPDLHIDAVHAFWDSYDRRTLYRVLVSLERVEHWTLDKDVDMEPAVLELGRSIDTADNIKVKGFELSIIRILAMTSAGRAMRILQSLDLASPGIASQLLMHAEEISEDRGDKKGNSYAKLFLRRNLVFERLQLLSRVLAPQRISLVLKALEHYGDNS